MCTIHVCTSEANKRWLSNTLPPFLPTFHHRSVSLPPFKARPHLSLSAAGACLSSPKCCCYFLPVTPICQGHAKATAPAPCPQWSPLKCYLNMSASCWIVFFPLCLYVDSLLLHFLMLQMCLCPPFFEAFHVFFTSPGSVWSSTHKPGLTLHYALCYCYKRCVPPVL